MHWMSLIPAFLGLEYGLVLITTGILATIGTAAALVAILFFTFAPYVSPRWAAEFGVGTTRDVSSEQSGETAAEPVQ